MSSRVREKVRKLPKPGRQAIPRSNPVPEAYRLRWAKLTV
jgi:hypothetical protein